MSIEAMSWVLKLDMSRSSEKFILVCLANYADERGICYPSAATLMRDTGQDRKTVLLNLKRLVEGGMLRDTGQRVGRTMGVIVYELVGMPTNSKVHYVYKTSNLVTGEFYIGKRSFNGDPNLDTYRGSGRWVIDMQSKGISLHKEVLEVFDTDVEARACEMRWFKQCGPDALCKNEGTPYALSRDPRNGRKTSGPENGTTSSHPVFPVSGPEIPASHPVFPHEQSQKRDTEPLKNESKSSVNRHKRGGAASDSFDPMKYLTGKGVDSKVASDWLKIRKVKKLAAIETAFDGVEREAIAYGLSLQEALTECCERGWGSFRAKWMEAEETEKKSGGQWWLSPESKLAKATEVGVGPALRGESDASWQARIQAAIDNGGKPTATKAAPVVEVRETVVQIEQDAKSGIPEDARRLMLQAAGLGKKMAVQSNTSSNMEK